MYTLYSNSNVVRFKQKKESISRPSVKALAPDCHLPAGPGGPGMPSLPSRPRQK